MTLTELLAACDEAIHDGRIVYRPKSAINLEGRPLNQELLRGCIIDGSGAELRIIPPQIRPIQ